MLHGLIGSQRRKHILTDLRPYFCTFPECEVDPGRLFSSRQSWFEHELAYHRREWQCPFSCGSMSSLELFEAHLLNAHGKSTSEFSPQALRGTEIPDKSTTEYRCPFCGESSNSRKKFQSHVARHQVQIALLAFWSVRPGQEDQEDDDGQSLSESEDTRSMANFSPMAVALERKRSTDDTTGPPSHEQSAIINNKITTPAETGENPVHSVSEGISVTRSKTAGNGSHRNWLLIRSWDIPYLGDELGGPLRIGHFLRDPLDIHSVFGNGSLSPKAKELIRQRTRRTESGSFNLSYWEARPSMMPKLLGILSASNNREFTNISVQAERLITIAVVPDDEMIRQLLTEAFGDVSTKSSQRFSLPSKRVYLVTGLMIAEGLLVDPGGTELTASTTLAGVTEPTEIRWGSGEPIIIGISVCKIEQSWQGNAVFGRYTKGAVL